jgi:predicted nucleic acid-binding protein
VIVVDASVVVARLLRTPGAAALDLAADLHAPELCDLEVASSLRQRIQRGQMTLEGAVRALADYTALGIALHGHRSLLTRCVALFENFTPYDASYVALAEALEAPLLTLDERLGRAVQRHTSVALVPT